MDKTSAIAEDSDGGSASTLIDITPAKYACSMTISCPALLKDKQSGTYVIIGKIRDPHSPGLRGRVGSGEMAIEISAQLVNDAVRPKHLRILAAWPLSLIQLTARRLMSFRGSRAL